ncbi:MAG: hypothetical protein AVDCRST_MAG34-1034, partial [uncultured Nocardioidaceae bacterium]
GLLGDGDRPPQAGRPPARGVVLAAGRGDHAADGRRLHDDRPGSDLLPRHRGPGVRPDDGGDRGAAGQRRRPRRRAEHRPVRLHLAAGTPAGHGGAGHGPARGHHDARAPGFQRRGAVHAGVLPGPERAVTGARLPLQAGHVLPLRAHGPAAAGQRARDPDARPPARRPSDRARRLAVDGALGRAGPL